MSENMSIKNLQDYMEKEKIQDKKIKELEEKLQDFKQTIAYLNEKLNKFISENKKKMKSLNQRNQLCRELIVI